MFFRLLPISALAAMLSGCIVVPTGLPDKQPFRTADTEFLSPGTTTKDEVRHAFDKPQMRGNDWWLYRTVRRGTKWVACSGAGYFAFCGDPVRSRTNYFLVVDFDGNTVDAYEVLDDEQLCDQRRICYSGDLFSTGFIAAATGDSPADRDDEPNCVIYLFTNSQREDVMSRIYLDEHFVGNLTTGKNHYELSTSPGDHHLTVLRDSEGDWLKRRNVSMLRVQCTAGQSVFAEYVTNGAKTSLIVVDEKQGRETVGRRWRADTTIDERHERVSWIGDRFFVVAAEGRISIFQPDRGGIVRSDAYLVASESCGYRTALADYGVTLPSIYVDHQPSLHYKRGFVEVKVVCNENGECELPSFPDGETCEATPTEQVMFNGDSFGLFSDHLLVLEPADGGAAEVFFGPKRPLKKHSRCEDKQCVIGLVSLREAAAE